MKRSKKNLINKIIIKWKTKKKRINLVKILYIPISNCNTTILNNIIIFQHKSAIGFYCFKSIEFFSHSLNIQVLKHFLDDATCIFVPR